MGRLTKDVELRQAGDTSVAKYTLAVNRSFKREGQPDVDFINCVVFGKSAEFAEKYFQKGQQVAVVDTWNFKWFYIFPFNISEHTRY